MREKVKVLFLCTGNSARSQIAEGWTRHLKGDLVEPYSAGIEAHGLNLLAVEVMREAGVDISRQKSKLVTEFFNVNFDFVITLCSHADENCPVFSGGAIVMHREFVNPVEMGTTLEEKLTVFRKVRDDIKAFVEKLPID
jgi:arsenate reductase